MKEDPKQALQIIGNMKLYNPAAPGDDLVKDHFEYTILKYALKELDECNISDTSKEESSMQYYNLYKDTKRQLQVTVKNVNEFKKEFDDLYLKYHLINLVPGTLIFKLHEAMTKLVGELK